MLNCISLVDELDRKDWLGLSRRNSFFNSMQKTFSSREKCRIFETYDAYAPLPIVFDIIRKGKSRGRGSSWLWNGSVLISIVPRTGPREIHAEDPIEGIYLESTHHIQRVSVLTKMQQKSWYPMSFVMITSGFESSKIWRVRLVESDGKRDWTRWLARLRVWPLPDRPQADRPE
jgi:hypothetical protein